MNIKHTMPYLKLETILKALEIDGNFFRNKFYLIEKDLIKFIKSMGYTVFGIEKINKSNY